MASDDRDLSGKTFLVTGANTGIGRVTAETLARRGGKVFLACRSEEKAAPVLASRYRVVVPDMAGRGASAPHQGLITMEAMLAGLDAAIARGGVDEARLGIAGGSYGGFMTNWAVGHSDRFKAAVTMRSVVNMATMFGVSDVGWGLVIDELSATPWGDLDRLMRFSPITFVEDINTPLLILHSDNDLRCPVEEAEQLFSALKYLQRETKLVRFEGQSHELSRSGHPRSRVIRLREIVGWFEQYMPVG